MKKTWLKQVILLSGFTILLNGCKKPLVETEGEIVETISTESLEQLYGCTHTTRLLSNRTWPQAGLPLRFTIGNQADFDRLVKAATCSPVIDFEKHTLLIGVETLNSGYHNINYDLKKITKSGKDTLTLTVNFQLNAASVVSEATWHIFMPKKLENIPLKVNMVKQ